MVERFIASNPGKQEPETFRQFTELQQYLQNFEERMSDVFGLVLIEDATLGDWAPLVPVPPVPVFPRGTYAIFLSAIANGTNANAVAQFRAGDFVTREYSIGNNRFMIQGTLVALENLEFTLEARGVSCALENVSATAIRIGAD